ncbi:MAG: biotin--[acetyl-CoA-carboxylase] ligase [Proteobacteria bacterium]|nr:biotin--[acetyl-CoA-carboxylase] ligase [Pseudomonadota bacterium]
MSLPADLSELSSRAAARGLGPVSVVAHTGSTNADLKALARAGAVHGSAYVADAQSAGKGRLGRDWVSPPGENLYLSVLLRPSLRFDRVPLICLGAAAVLAEIAGTPLHIKWPNDLLAPDGRKVAGLLAEAEQRGGVLQWLVLGIGVNVRSAPDTVPATSLGSLGGQTDRTELALALLQGLHALPDQVATRPQQVLARWRVHAKMLGERVRVAGHEGRAVDIDTDGALLVQTRSGVQRVLAGDVEMVALPGR